MFKTLIWFFFLLKHLFWFFSKEIMIFSAITVFFYLLWVGEDGGAYF